MRNILKISVQITNGWDHDKVRGLMEEYNIKEENVISISVSEGRAYIFYWS